ncbi:MAG: PAS domain-containing protein [Alphaproteobacteria bacterium]|nr:PAS domain-containing protein [Alphaproteobacteria bacterium]
MADIAIIFEPGKGQLPPCDTRIEKFFSYWLSIRLSAGRLPSRQHFNPADLKNLLPYLWMLDVYRNPLRLKYRLVGTEHVHAAGWDPTGKWFDEVHSSAVHSAHYSQFTEAAEHAMICFFKGQTPRRDISYFRDPVPGTSFRDPLASLTPKRHLEKIFLERLITPFAQNGIEVDRLVGISIVISYVPELDSSAAGRDG